MFGRRMGNVWASFAAMPPNVLQAAIREIIKLWNPGVPTESPYRSFQPNRAIDPCGRPQEMCRWWCFFWDDSALNDWAVRPCRAGLAVHIWFQVGQSWAEAKARPRTTKDAAAQRSSLQGSRLLGGPQPSRRGQTFLVASGGDRCDRLGSPSSSRSGCIRRLVEPRRAPLGRSGASAVSCGDPRLIASFEAQRAKNGNTRIASSALSVDVYGAANPSNLWLVRSFPPTDFDPRGYRIVLEMGNAA